MFKALIIVAVIAAAIFFGVKYHKAHPGGAHGVNPVVVNPVGSFPNPYKS